MKSFLLFITILSFSILSKAQTSTVQFIHNSADKIADTVDIYINNVKLIDNLRFRTSTPFINIPSGSSVQIKVTDHQAANSSNPLHSQTVSLTSNDSYVAILEGLLGTGYAPPRSMVPFNVNLQSGAKTNAASGTVDLLFHQGATDVRNMVTLEIPGKNPVFQNVDFGDIVGYVNKAVNDYTFQLRETSSQQIVGEFSAPFSSNNYSGAALTILTSGFNRPNVNNFGSDLGLYLSLPSGGNLVKLLEVPPSDARVQFIHNSADASVSTVDVWANNTLLYDDLQYLYCKAFEDFPSDSTIDISITASNSVDTTNSILKKTINISGYNTHIFILEGINSSTGYTPGSNKRPLVLHHINNAREVSAFPNNTDLGFHNGSTDLDVVDFYNSVIPSFLIIDDIEYRETSGYIPFATQNFDIQARYPREGRIIAQFRLPLLNLGFQDSAGLVITSGFLDPSVNSNGNDLGLYYAPPAGGPLLEFQKVNITSTLVQILHNSPDVNLDTVDIYVGNNKRVDNLVFRSSTRFLDIHVDSNQTISILPSNSTNASNPIYSKTVNYDEQYSRYLILEGVNGPGYTPSSTNNPLTLREYEGARMRSLTPNNTDVLFYNGSTDAGSINIDETTEPIWGLASGLNLGDFSNFHELDNKNYQLEVSNASQFIAKYEANFQSLNLDDKAIVVLTSGFLEPIMNNNGPSFGLYASLPEGGKFIKLPEMIGVGIDDNLKKVNLEIYPNPSNGNIFVNSTIDVSRELNINVFDSNGKLIHQEVTNLPTGETKSPVDLRHLSNGIYIIQLTSEQEVLKSDILQIVK